MGSVRNGARTFLNILAHACKLSHLPGFQAGVTAILGEGAETTLLLTTWNTMCTIVETLIAADNYYNQVDYQDETDNEDIVPA